MDAIVSTPSATDFLPQIFSTDSLEDEITELAASITVATARLLLLIAELDRREGTILPDDTLRLGEFTRRLELRQKGGKVAA